MSASSTQDEQQEYRRKTSGSAKIFEESSAVFPGGVNSAIQFFPPYPVYVQSGYGSTLLDVEGNSYIDFCLAYGAMTAGHRNPAIVNAIVDQVKERGSILGAPSPGALNLAKEVMHRIPSIKMLRFCNSGAEATMYAVRLARAMTKRDKIIKMEGAYHGAHDYLLVSDKPKDKQVMGPDDRPASVADSAGTPRVVSDLTLVAQFNIIENVEKRLKENQDQVAAIVTEPIQTNSGIVLPREGFLKALRDLADRHSALLIFDEIKAGFNASFSASSQIYGVEPDLTTLGKVVGGGTPLAAFGGKAEYMQDISPLGATVHYGTYNANGLSTAAGTAALKSVFTEESHRRMSDLSAQLAKALRDALRDSKIEASVVNQGNMGAIYFGLKRPPSTFREAFDADGKVWSRWWLRMISSGVIPYGGAWFEEWFVSAMHTKEDIEAAANTSYEVFKGLSKAN